MVSFVFDLSNCVKGPSLTDVKTSVVQSVKTFGHWVIASPMNDETPTQKCVTWFRTIGSAVGLAKAEPKHNAWCLGRIFTVATRMTAVAGATVLAAGATGYAMIGTGVGLQVCVDKLRPSICDQELVSDSGVLPWLKSFVYKQPPMYTAGTCGPETTSVLQYADDLGQTLEKGGELVHRPLFAGFDLAKATAESFYLSANDLYKEWAQKV